MSGLADAGPAAAHTVRTKIDEILARPEYHPRENPVFAWFEKVWSKLLHALSDLFGISSNAAGSLMLVLVYVGLAALLVLLVVSVVRRRGAVAKGSAKPSVDPEVQRAQRVQDYLQRARAAEKAGDLVLALRLYFTALVVALGERGDLEYRDAWTNRELLERGEPRPEVAEILRPLVPGLDAKSFGREPAEPADVARMSRLCEQVLAARAVSGAR